MMKKIENPQQLTMYEALNIGYMRDESKQKEALKKFDYELDEGLTNYEHLTAYNQKEKKLLYVVNGTDPLRPKDILTDLYLVGGGIRQTSRFKSDKKAYEKARSKYDEKNTVIVAHSLGANIGSKLDKSKDVKILTFNGASTIGERSNPRETSYRTRGDIVSLLKPKSKIVKQTYYGTSKISPQLSLLLDPHNIKNIKNKNIFV